MYVCMYVQVKELSLDEEARPKNTLLLSGPFSISLMHEWISFVLPEVGR